MMKRVFFVFLTLLCLVSCALGEPEALIPSAAAPADAFEPVALYCGPTQGFYRRYAQTIDLTQPFVCFGQYDCWSMVAQGTPDAFGPVGWIEGGLLQEDGFPELSFEEGFAAMIEDTAAVTDDPQKTDSSWAISLPRGTQVTVLASYGGWLYVQTEIEGLPSRVFIPASAL